MRSRPTSFSIAAQKGASKISAPLASPFSKIRFNVSSRNFSSSSSSSSSFLTSSALLLSVARFSNKATAFSFTSKSISNFSETKKSKNQKQSKFSYSLSRSEAVAAASPQAASAASSSSGAYLKRTIQDMTNQFNIRLLRLSGDEAGIDRVLSGMKATNVPFDALSYRFAILGYAQCRVESAFKKIPPLFVDMRAKGFNLFAGREDDDPILAAAITSFGTIGRTDFARALFDQHWELLREERDDRAVLPSSSIFTSILEAYSSADQPDKCMEILDEMRLNAVTPTSSQFNSVLRAHVRSADYAKAQASFFSLEQHRGMKPDARSHFTMLLIATNAGARSDANLWNQVSSHLNKMDECVNRGDSDLSHDEIAVAQSWVQKVANAKSRADLTLQHQQAHLRKQQILQFQKQQQEHQQKQPQQQSSQQQNKKQQDPKKK